MRSKSVVLLGLALGCGAIASVGISQVMERNRQQGDPGDAATIFVALTDINVNEPLTPQNVKLEEWPKDKVPNGALTKLEEVQGKRVRYKLLAGEPIMSNKVAGSGEIGSASKDIPPGFRSMAVKVDAVSSSGSLILPGDHVDVLVYVTKNPSTGITDTSTRTILQNVTVFAVDTTTQALREKDETATALAAAKTITLLVTPAQAEKVTLASELGSLRLVLRSPEDNVAGESYGAKVSDIFGSSETNRAPDNSTAKDFLSFMRGAAQPEQSPTPPANAFTMVVIEGDQIREIQFDAGGHVPANASPTTDGRPAPPPTNTPKTIISPTPIKPSLPQTPVNAS